MTKGIKTRIGILGGGQLGKMLMEAGSSLNLSYHFLEKSTQCPASLVNDNQVVGTLQDEQKIQELADRSDVLTYEIEHVNATKLKQLEGTGSVVLPSSDVLEIIQDKGLQKQFFTSQGVNTLPYKIASKESLHEKIAEWPENDLVLKHRKGGYDGKGVQVLTKADFNKLFSEKNDSILSEHGYVIEKCIQNPVELSVIVAVGLDGEYKTYELSEMVFDDRSNLMDYLISPSSVSKEIASKAKEIAINAVLGFKSAGLFAVELFVDENSEVYVNEIAPRPHNSGHHTIESCYTSQYEQLNRILCNLPLGNTDLLCPALTCNIVGSQDVTGKYTLAGVEQVMSIKGVYIHMYGKEETKPFRKLGHFTVLGDSREDCITKMEQVKNHLEIKSN